jgi:hypothetical protein
LLDLIVGGVDFGNGEALPPVLVVEVDLVDVEELSRDLENYYATTKLMLLCLLELFWCVVVAAIGTESSFVS